MYLINNEVLYMKLTSKSYLASFVHFNKALYLYFTKLITLENSRFSFCE